MMMKMVGLQAVLLLSMLLSCRLVYSEQETEEEFLKRSLAHAAQWQGELEEQRAFGRELGAFGPGVRTNFCNSTLKAATMGQAGLAALPVALKGKTVTVAYAKNAPSAYLKLDPKTYRPICEASQSVGCDGGFLYNMLQQLASIGQFTFTYVLTPIQPSSMTDDVYVANITSYYDMVAKVSFDTTARRLLGVGFTPPLVVADIIFITDTLANFQTAPFDVYGFLQPFTYQLWGYIIILMVVHATLLYLVDHLEFRRNVLGSITSVSFTDHRGLTYGMDLDSIPDDEHRDSKESGVQGDEMLQEHIKNFKRLKQANKLLLNTADEKSHPPLWYDDYLYSSMAAYTNTDNYEPVKRTNKMLHLAYSFFIVIMVASYTANLASILIGSSNSLLVSSISEADQKKMRVCFRKGGATIAFTTQLFQNIVPVYSSTTSNNEVLDMLAAGKCVGAVLAQNDWQIAGTTTHNPDCRLRVTGPPVRSEFVALPYKLDSLDYCTTAFGTVIGDLISSQMEAFYMQQLWANTLAANTIVPCITENVPIPLDNSTQFNLESLRGIFFFYFGGTGVFVACHLIGVCYSAAKTKYKLKAKAKAKYKEELERVTTEAAAREQGAIAGDEESGQAEARAAAAAAAYEEQAEYFDSLDHKLNRTPMREALPYTGVLAEEDEPWVIAARERDAIKLEGPPVVSTLCGVEDDGAFLDTLMFPINGLMGGGTQRSSTTPAELEMQQIREQEQALASRKRMLNAVVDEAESNASSNDAFNAYADFDSDSDAEADGGERGWLNARTNAAAAAARPQLPKHASAEDKENAIMARALRRILKYMEEPPTKEMLEKSQSQINDVLALLVRNKNKKEMDEVKRRNTIFAPPPPPSSLSLSAAAATAAAAAAGGATATAAASATTGPAPSPQRIRLGASSPNPSSNLQGPNQNALVNRAKEGLRKDLSSTDEEEELFYG